MASVWCLWLVYKVLVEIFHKTFIKFLFQGYDAFGGVDFEGTFFVDTQMDDDYIGFVFR